MERAMKSPAAFAIDGPEPYIVKAGSRTDRRQFMASVAAAGAATVLAGVRSSAAGQATAAPTRIIDVHHHFASPNYIASLAARNVGNNLDRFKADTPEKHL